MKKIPPIKIVIGGEGGTGKSTLLKVKDTGEFSYSCEITIGVDFACLEMPWKNNLYPLLIYDLGGQERFHFLHDSYIKGTKAAIILYDMTREKTFQRLSHWFELLYSENKRIPIVIAGSKKDLIQKEDLLHYNSLWEKSITEWNNKFNIIGHFFISSKDNDGIDEIFNQIFKKIQILPYFPPISSICS